MVLLGFLTFTDPPKLDAAQVLQALKTDGVQVKILTGDNELVTRHVCEQVGLDSSRIVLGTELDHMSDDALAHGRRTGQCVCTCRSCTEKSYHPGTQEAQACRGLYGRWDQRCAFVTYGRRWHLGLHRRRCRQGCCLYYPA